MKTLLVTAILGATSVASPLFPATAQKQFHEVTDQVGFVAEAKKSKGNGVLDLIVPATACHPRAVLLCIWASPTALSPIRSSCGFSYLNQFNSLDSTDWHGFFNDYNADGNIDLYIVEGAVRS